MRKLLLIFFLACSPAMAADIEFLLNYSYSTPGCTTAASVNCVESFEVRDQRDGTVLAVATATPGANTPAIDIPASAIGYPRLGNRTFAAYAIGRTNEGGRIESIPSNEVSVVLRPEPATNARGQQK